MNFFKLINIPLIFLAAFTLSFCGENSRCTEKKILSVFENKILAVKPGKMQEKVNDTDLVDIAFNRLEAGSLLFFKTPADANPAYSVKISSLNYNSGFDSLMASRQDWFQPLELGEHGHLFFKCISRKNNFYQVVTNEKTGKALWLKAAGNIRPQDWLSYFKDCDGLGITGKIKTKPEEHAPLFKKIASCYTYTAAGIKGNWLKLYVFGYCAENINETQDFQTDSAWTKWKSGNKILIFKGYNE